MITCGKGECHPANVATIAAEPEEESSALPNFSAVVQEIGRAKNCSDSFHATDITESSETWMVKCSDGTYIVVQCSDGECGVRE